MTASLRLPTFLFLGPPRTASTWLFRCLNEHPQIYVPDIKEIHFFNTNYEKGRDWYARFFDTVPADVTAIGELTPGYLAHPAGPERIHDTLGPDLDLFVVARNPVDRAYSHYQMRKNAGRIAPEVGFSQALEREPDLVEHGLYKQNIDRYLQVFARKRLHVIDYDQIDKNPAVVVRFIYQTLGVSDTFSPSLLHTRINPALDQLKHPGLFRSVAGLGRSINTTAAGRKVMWFLRERGMIRLWHRLVTRQTAPAAEGVNEERQRLYQHYFQADWQVFAQDWEIPQTGR